MFIRKKLLLNILILVAFVLATMNVSCAPAEEEKEALKVAMVVSGGLGDRSFFDSGAAGLKKAEEELGVETQILECKLDPSAYYDHTLAAAENNDLVFIIGFQMVDQLGEIAPKYPDTQFVYIDGIIEGIENVASIDYLENEGSYVVGAMAAMATTRTEIPGINEEKIIGLVGGMDIPVIHNFVVGFEQGARDIDPEVKVEVVYTGSFEDPAKGKEATLAIIDKGADVVFQVAGKTGEGIIEACKEKGVYVIGVDSDQGWLAPGTVIESMMKEVGMSIYETIKKFQDGTYEKGSVYSYGVKEDGVGPTFSDEYAKILPQEIIDKMKEIEQKIISGEIVVEEAK